MRVYTTKLTQDSVVTYLQWRRQAWGTGGRAPLELANARKFVVCSGERDMQQIDIERVVDRFDALAQNRHLALK